MHRNIGDFYIERNSENVRVTYRKKQTICFHVYGDPHKAKLDHFTNAIIKKRKLDLNTLYSTAKTHNITSMNVDTKIIF